MTGATPFLQEVQRQLEEAGALPGQDFVVHSVTRDGASGDNFGLRPTDDGFEVYYDERGERSVLLATADAEQARSLFVRRVVELARSRGSAGPT